ncbi:cytochrome C [Dyella sp. 2HG41-7]|uniref:cytochrome C n=1 Tax=Dyella sp. 2HG41-7 TaxID=2883239 RepID=UPI001F2F088C|nr:cytochrome C [Dyella sp. 2HG41-7]
MPPSPIRPMMRAARRQPSTHPYMWYGTTALLMLASTSAHAVPAFARQTGSSCADCHAGAYGPALTPFGMKFKLNGYTDTDGNGLKIPVAAQLIGTHNVPTRGQVTNDLTEADIYLAGRLTEHFGGFVKVETDNVGNDKYNTKLSNMDLRFVLKDLKVGEKDAVFGVSVNNSPGFEDPIADLPDASILGPPSTSGTLLNLSSTEALADRVIGTTVYGLYDSNWYGELGTYTSMPTSTQSDLGYSLSGDPGRIKDTVYGRFAYMKDMKRQFFSGGVVALTTKRQRPRSAQADDIMDLGYDATYQYLGDRDNIIQLSYVNIYERRRYGFTPPAPGLPGLVALPRGVVHDQTFTFTYTFKQSYGVVYAHLVSTGTHDAVRYVPYGDPNTTSNLLTLFWTPFGKDDSFTSIANLKLAATWFRFSRFNGSTTNIFGVGPGALATNAKDLNAFSFTASIAF